MKRAKSNVEKSRTITIGYTKNIREQSEAIAKTPSQPTWNHPRSNDDALILLAKRVEHVLAQRDNNTLQRTWDQLIRSNSNDFPVLLHFATESLRLQSVRLVPNSERYSNFRKALFLQPFSIEMEIQNEDVIETTSVNTKTSKISSLSTDSAQRISTRSQLNTICNEMFQKPMMYASSEHTVNNKTIWQEAITHPKMEWPKDLIARMAI